MLNLMEIGKTRDFLPHIEGRRKRKTLLESKLLLNVTEFGNFQLYKTKNFAHRALHLPPDFFNSCS